MTEPRHLNEAEWQVFEALLSIEFPGREEIREQIRNARVRTIDENGSLEILTVAGHRAPVVRRVPVEAEGRDADGTAVHVLLHVVDGKATELELYRIDGARIQAWPNRDGWELFAPPGPRNSQG